MSNKVIFHSVFILLLILVIAIFPAYSVDVTVGLLAGDNNLGEVEEAAYNWADEM